MSVAPVPELISVPGGSFLMGENEEDKFADDTERPRHLVSVAPFLMGKTPVTIGEFRLFCPEHETGLPEEWPATMVSWNEASAYCGWLSEHSGREFRLPTEAEWEFAARAGSQTPYPWGTTLTPEQANYFYTEQGDKVGPGQRSAVSSYPPNALGLCDMIGNVCEWVQDAWQPDYSCAADDGSAWELSGNRNETLPRVLRGGAWDYLPRLLRCSWRDRMPEPARRDNVGFRLASSD